jgi:hypothetical protein
MNIASSRIDDRELFELAAQSPVKDAPSVDEIVGYAPDALPSS